MNFSNTNYGLLATVGMRFTLASLVALICLFLWWNLGRVSGPNWIVWLLQSAPLALFIPGIVKRNHRLYTWLCFVLLFYFIKAVEGVFLSNASFSDALFLSLTVTAFLLTMFTSRWLQRS